MIKFLIPFLEEIESEIQYQRGEATEDLAKMIEIITLARQERLGGPIEEHIAVALTVTCPRPYPGKPPEYRESIRGFRLNFIGLSKYPAMQEEFTHRLHMSLLTLPLEELDFSSVDRLFTVFRETTTPLGT